jgi:hypothetical protein
MFSLLIRTTGGRCREDKNGTKRSNSKRQTAGANNLRLLKTAHTIFTKLLTGKILSTELRKRKMTN